MNPSAMPRSRAPAMAQTLIASASLHVRSESPDQPAVRAMLGALDDYLALYERAGYRRRAAFAGYPDNGLSLFYEKHLGR